MVCIKIHSSRANAALMNEDLNAPQKISQFASLIPEKVFHQTTELPFMLVKVICRLQGAEKTKALKQEVIHYSYQDS